MMRIRICRVQKGTLEYLYLKTCFIKTLENFKDIFQHLIERGDLELGDVIYTDDFYLRLDSIEPLKFTCLDPQRPELQGLGGQIEEAERSVGDAW